MVSLLGSRDELLAVIERSFRHRHPRPRQRDHHHRRAAESALVTRVFDELIALLDQGEPLTPDAVERTLAMLRTETKERPADVLTLNILSNRGKHDPAQDAEPEALRRRHRRQHTIVFGIGPAGTGKTYLAMAKAVQALQAKQVNRIILTRPAVEAGERLGFLPGTLYDKIDPYLRPLYDALHDMVDPESIPRLMAAGHDRGGAAGLHARAHAQRRVHHPGRGAEHLARADEDVPDPARLRLQDGRHRRRHPGRPAGGHHVGLRVVRDILDGIDDVHFSILTSDDVVRHRLVGEIVDAYGRYDAAERHGRPARPAGPGPAPDRAGG